MPTLIIKHRGRTRGIVLAGRVLIGRWRYSGIAIGNPDVSRLHAWIDSDGEHYYVADADSRTGTTINGELLLERRILQEGDVVGVGPGLIYYHDAAELPKGVMAVEVNEHGIYPGGTTAGILFTCDCDAPLWVQDQFAGKAGMCRYCQRKLVVPMRSIASPPWKIPEPAAERVLEAGEGGSRGTVDGDGANRAGAGAGVAVDETRPAIEAEDRAPFGAAASEPEMSEPALSLPAGAIARHDITIHATPAGASGQTVSRAEAPRQADSVEGRRAGPSAEYPAGLGAGVSATGIDASGMSPTGRGATGIAPAAASASRFESAGTQFGPAAPVSKKPVICSICQSPILAADLTTDCPDCGLKFHVECWQENRGCSAYGCPQVNILEQKTEGVAAENPSGAVSGTAGTTGAGAGAVAAGTIGAEEGAGVMEDPDAAFPWAYLLLAAAVFAVAFSAISFGAPSVAAGFAALAYLLRRKDKRHTGVLVLAMVLSVAGAAAGVAVSLFWWLNIQL